VLFILAVVAIFLSLVAAVIPSRPWSAGLIALAVVANIVGLTAYAFGEDGHTADGRSRWETHGETSHHVAYVVILVVLIGLVAAAAGLSKRPIPHRLVALCTVAASFITLAIGILAFDND
jgi:hypothetical protein